MNNIQRDEFIRIFCKIDVIIDNYEFENDKIKIWHWEDETFILEKDSGIIVSWYKHIGRANNCNKKLTIANYEEYSKRILQELLEGE